MNRIGLICRYLKENPHSSQRDLAQKMELSLGTVNTLIKECMNLHYIAPGKSIAGTYELTCEGETFLNQFKVDGALILAAGFGSRFVPLMTSPSIGRSSSAALSRSHLKPRRDSLKSSVSA